MLLKKTPNLSTEFDKASLFNSLFKKQGNFPVNNNQMLVLKSISTTDYYIIYITENWSDAPWIGFEIFFLIWSLYVFFQSIRDELRVKIANSYRMTAKKDHVNVLQRRNIIEQRKEQLEHMNDQRVCTSQN